MILRDPRCEGNDCDYDENGVWHHIETCQAPTRQLPYIDASAAPPNSFLGYLLRGPVDVQVDVTER